MGFDNHFLSFTFHIQNSLLIILNEGQEKGIINIQ